MDMFFFGCTNFDHPKQFFGSNWQNIDTRVTKFWEYDNYHIINLWQKFEVPEVDMRADVIIFIIAPQIAYLIFWPSFIMW